MRSESLTSRGVVMPRVFHDNDQNGTFEGVDEPVSDAAFTVGRSSHQRGSTDGRGLGFIEDLPADRLVKVSVDRDTFENPFALPSREGVNVVPRPGRVTVADFPVVLSGEIEGTVYQQITIDLKPLSGINVQLIDSEGTIVDETTSAFDGFYLLDFVPPGTYTVRVDPQQAARLQMEPPGERTVTVEGDGSIVRGQRLILLPFVTSLE